MLQMDRFKQIIIPAFQIIFTLNDIFSSGVGRCQNVGGGWWGGGGHTDTLFMYLR